MHPIIALWSHPRSMSTATERIMRERGDLDCAHEPFMYDYYVHRQVRKMPHFDVQDGHPTSYGAIRDMLLARGETLALTGESGSGKSTLLHIIGGLDRPDSGIVAIDGVDIGAMDDAGRAGMRRDKVSLVFQQFNLIPSLTVASNIGFHARLSGRLDQNWIKELADRLGLSAQLGKYPEQLSGGQQQRVAIARTLAAKPALILADEPTGNLDEETADKVMELMMTLAIETDAALLLVTHSHRLAGRMGRRLHLRAGQIERAEE